MPFLAQIPECAKAVGLDIKNRAPKILSGIGKKLGVPFVLFVAREAFQESLGFSPGELVFSHTHREPLKSLRDELLSYENSQNNNVLDYVSKFCECLHHANSLPTEEIRDSFANETSPQLFHCFVILRVG